MLVVHPSVEEARAKRTAHAVAPDLGCRVRTAGRADRDAGRDSAREPTRRAAPSPTRIWITWCDQIGVHPETIATLQRLSERSIPIATIVMPTARQENPYIHLERDAEGRIVAIRHRREGDAMPPVGESDIGIVFAVPDGVLQLAAALWSSRLIERPRHANATFCRSSHGWCRQGHRVFTFPCTDEMEAVGVNTPDDRRRLERYLAERDRS